MSAFLDLADALARSVGQDLQAWIQGPAQPLSAGLSEPMQILARQAGDLGLSAIAQLAFALAQTFQAVAHNTAAWIAEEAQSQPTSTTTSEIRSFETQHCVWARLLGAGHEELMRLLHQLAAGFTKEVKPQVLQALSQPLSSF